VARRSNNKLSYKYFGPYLITQKIGKVAYKLQLPPSSQIHPVIHVLQLKKALPPSAQVNNDELLHIFTTDPQPPTHNRNLLRYSLHVFSWWVMLPCLMV
jgi:hypothetical protein